MRPERLRNGDVVALVAPAGPVQEGQAEDAARILRGWGLRVRFGRYALGERGFLSGTDDERLADLNDALRDPEVRGVVCLRGGYGSQRIAERVDFDAVRADPKLFLGFSDITALHAAFWCETGLATVHGSVTADGVREVLMTGEPVVVHGLAGESGKVTGTLLGGNLTMLATNAGTPHQLDLTNAILLLEEVGEAPYRIDRMLTQLQRSGALDGVAGIALGQFLPHEPEELRLGVPMLRGLEIGHGDRQVAVGLGVSACLDAEAGTLTVEPVCRTDRRNSAAAAPPSAAGR
ncbi:muramoyltetrapeptide carboxypeptidase [Actinoplanes lutulentus]|uniref:Muramoyltetrapeptide carboxypeptidase n=1 Tax=Actinoplanes lutulentus TaxID=1287878 RepID=A0A327Z9K3_9ACTN|nr:LD-carboxypeptidase [Actinoplanes lutulentus]MBB2946710.1 muramoyltetrapeptide carboxypeptidase [Actinoplanes lutulentus]RAK35602.1 muramoyltetrapeptide carboxypeptidase [Actinoplanes lutulentus]